MKKKWKKITILSILTVFLLSPFQVNAAGERTLGDYRRTYENYLKEKQENDNKNEQAKNEIARKEQAIKDAEADLTKAKKDEAETQEKIVESNEKIKKLSEESKNVLLYLQQMQSQNAYIQYITGASSVTDLIMRVAAVERLSDDIKNTMKKLEDEIKRNEQLTIELQEKQKQLEKNITSYQAVIAAQYSKIEEYDKFALGIDDKVKSAKQTYEMQKKLCKDTIGRTDDDVIVTTCSNVTNSGWLKPLKYGYITSTIGSRWGSYHNALDIGGNAEGTPVYAAAAGRVSGKIDRYRCGGNMLYIDVIVNGVQYTTYYYHLLRFNVSVGDVVDQNTIIGWVGGGRSTSSAYGGYDTCTTGAHLHFGVSKGWFTGSINRSNVITPPGFPNKEGYRFYSRFDYWG